MEVKKIDDTQITNAIDLIWQTFLQFEAPDYSEEGVKSFQEFIENKEIIKTLEFWGAYDEEELKSALKKSGFYNRLSTMPEGLNTYLYKDFNKKGIIISGGEAQKIAIARAIYKNAPFIILDEPTAALDSIAEADIYQKYDEMTKGKSSVYISHRLASTRFCSRILMLEQGEIQEEGTHEELLRQSGKYAALYEVQSKYYREGDGENEDK